MRPTAGTSSRSLRFADDMGCDLEERVEVPRFATLLGAMSVCAASILFARQSRAETTPEPIAWTYSAPADCPPAEAFEREFRARTQRAELVASVTDAARSFWVAISN